MEVIPKVNLNKLIGEVEDDIKINNYRHQYLRKYYGYRNSIKKRSPERAEKLREIVPKLSNESFFKTEGLRFIIANGCFHLKIDSNPCIVLHAIYNYNEQGKKPSISDISYFTGFTDYQVKRSIEVIKLQLNAIEPKLGTRFLRCVRGLEGDPAVYFLDLDLLIKITTRFSYPKN